MAGSGLTTLFANPTGCDLAALSCLELASLNVYMGAIDSWAE